MQVEVGACLLARFCKKKSKIRLTPVGVLYVLTDEFNDGVKGHDWNDCQTCDRRIHADATR